MKCTSVFGKTIKAFNDPDCRYIVSVGSTRSSKTYSALQLILIHVLSQPNVHWICTSITFNKVRLTIMRDWQDIILQEGVEDRFDCNLSEHIWTSRKTGSKVEFIACETEAKARGIKSTNLLIDEANTVEYAIADALIVRCTGKVILTLNPSSQGWIEDFIIPQPDCRRIHSTYKDNEFLTKEQVRSIESHKTDERWWKVFALGQYAGGYYSVYSNWRLSTDEDDFENRFKNAECLYYGLDWGYSTDPTACVCCVKEGKRLYIKSLIYTQHLLNEEIADILNEKVDKRRTYRFVYDCAEQKSGDTVKKLTGIHLEPSKKGPDSIRAGIARLQEFELILDKNCPTLAEEFSQYSWVVDKATNKATNVPEDKNNHCFVADTMVRTIDGDKKIVDLKVGDLVLTSNGYHAVTQVFDNGRRKVRDYSLFFNVDDVVKITATPEHKIKIGRYKWREFQKLAGTEKLFRCSTESRITSTMGKITGQIQSESKKAVKDYISQCGNTTTEKCRKGTIYTTRTKTKIITKSKTLNALLHTNTFADISRNECRTRIIERNAKGEWIMRGYTQASGTRARKEGKGIGQSALSQYKTLCTTHIPASVAVRSTNLVTSILNTQNSVQTTVRQRQEGKAELITRQESAQSAEKNLRSTNTQSNSPVQKSVLLKVQEENERIEHVYDIEVEGMHEFFANGVLVHNCCDSLRYIALNCFSTTNGIKTKTRIV